MELLEGIIGGIAVEAGIGAAKHAGNTVADAAGEAEKEGVYIGGPQYVPLWSDQNPAWDEIDILDTQQKALVKLLLRQRDNELDKLLAALASNVAYTRVRNFAGVVGDTVQIVQLPNLGGGIDQWRLEGIVAWGDPANAADAALQIGGNLPLSGMKSGNVFSVGMNILAPKGNVTTIQLGIPARDADKLSINLTGTNGDRVAAIFRFKRG